MKYHQPFDQPSNPDASYVDANPSLGVRGSIPPAAAFEQAQREILKVITEAGITPSDADLTQLWQAIQSIAGSITNTAITNYLTGGAVDVNIPYAVAGGTADVITGTFAPVLTSLTDGQVVVLKVGAASNATTGPTLNGNALGAKIIIRNDGSALAAGDLPANGFAILIYDLTTTSWRFVAGFSAGGAGGGAFVPGCIYWWPTETAPTGALECNGAAVSRTTYSRLYGIIGTTYGVGDGSTTFNLPELRGEFIRGWDHGRGVDPDRTIRTTRGDGTTGDHVGTKEAGVAGPVSITGASVEIDNVEVWDTNTVTDSGNPRWQNINSAEGSVANLGGAQGAIMTLIPSGGSDPVTVTKIQGSMNVAGVSGSSETRPRNVNLMPLIAY